MMDFTNLRKDVETDYDYHNGGTLLLVSPTKVSYAHNRRGDRLELIREAVSTKDAAIVQVWEGKWRSDAFLITDLGALYKASGGDVAVLRAASPDFVKREKAAAREKQAAVEAAKKLAEEFKAEQAALEARWNVEAVARREAIAGGWDGHKTLDDRAKAKIRRMAGDGYSTARIVDELNTEAERWRYFDASGAPFIVSEQEVSEYVAQWRANAAARAAKKGAR